MIRATVHAPPGLTRGRRRRTWAVVGTVALVASLTACQPRPDDEYKFRNETEHDLYFGPRPIPAGKTVTVTEDGTGCLDGVVLTTEVGDVVAVVEEWVCDGETVTIRPGHLTKDEAHAAITNHTDDALEIDLPLGGDTRLQPGETVEFALFREEGGCREVAMEVEAGEDGLHASPPDQWCDGDTWVIEPADLWIAEDEPLHPGVVTVMNDGADGVTVKASDVEPDMGNGLPVSVFAGTPQQLEPPGLQAGRCIRTAIEVQRRQSMQALTGPWLRSDVVDLCDGDVLRLTADGGLVLLRSDGTDVPTGALVKTTAAVLVTNSSGTRITTGLSMHETMIMEQGATVEIPLRAGPGECTDDRIWVDQRPGSSWSENTALCDGDIAMVTADAITVTGADGSQRQ